MARSTRANVSKRFGGERLCARLHVSDEGNTIVEVALMLPILMTVVLGIFVVGTAYTNKLELTNAVGVAEPFLAASTTASTSDPCADTYNQIKNNTASFNQSNITLTLNLEGTIVNGSGVLGGGKTCAGDQSVLNQGLNVTVTATYPCSLVIYGHDFAPGCQLSATLTQPGS